MTEFLQPKDFWDECVALNDLISDFEPSDFQRVTRFKDWTVNDVLQHLHIWNWGVVECLNDTEEGRAYIKEVVVGLSGQESLRAIEKKRVGSLLGLDLLSAWWVQSRATADAFAEADPKARVAWAGPSMSARSAITARLMETWSHAQAIYDLLGVARADTDRIRNIAHMGVGTFAWSFSNRGLPVPESVPQVRLTGPSGAIWSWNEENNDDLIEGSATGFCQVVAQTRNVADTDLSVSGDTARQWMAIAQCFAGPANDPPAPGQRGPE